MALKGTAASAQHHVKIVVVLHQTRMHNPVAGLEVLEVACRKELWPER